MRLVERFRRDQRTKARTQGGFTLIELMLVLLLLALLVSLAVPVVTGGIQYAKESTLKEDVYAMRKAIDDFYADTGAYPQELEDLVNKRYLRRIPIDPITERRDTWTLVRAEEEGESASAGGIVDVYSGAEEKASDGTHYKEW